MLKQTIRLLFLLISTCLALSYADETGKLFVLKSPPYFKYDLTSAAPLKISEFKDLLLSENGFSIGQPIEWKGLVNENSFLTPKATLLFLINDKNVRSSVFGDKFIPIDEDTTLNFNYLGEHYFGKYGTNDQFVSLPYLPTDLDTELKSLESKCSQTLSTVFYVFQISEWKSNENDLLNAINKTIEKFENVCSHNLQNGLKALLLTTNHNQRVRRDASADSNSTGTIINPAVFYSNQYPDMFNILFWTSLLLGIAVFSIAYCMCSMDPGLDTVIYRMTSQRIKKDQ